MNTKAIKTCSEFLSYCLSIGFHKNQLDALQDLWWEHHDENGNIKQFSLYKDHPTTATGSVAAPKPDEYHEKWYKIIQEVLQPQKHQMCRDCADEDGTCPNNNGLPCDTTDEVIERFKRLQSEIEALKKLTATGSVAAPKPNEYKLDDGFVKVMDKALIDTLSKQLERSQSELAAAKESIKELIPIAETGVMYRESLNIKCLADTHSISRAKALLEH